MSYLSLPFSESGVSGYTANCSICKVELWDLPLRYYPAWRMQAIVVMMRGMQMTTINSVAHQGGDAVVCRCIIYLVLRNADSVG